MAGKTDIKLPNNHRKTGGVAQSSVQLDLCTTLKRKEKATNMAEEIIDDIRAMG